MGQVTFSANKDGQPDLTFTVVVSDEAIDAVLEAQNSLLVPCGVVEQEAVLEVPAILNEYGDVVSAAVAAVPAVMRPANTKETFDALCRKLVDDVLSSTKDFHARRAQEKASLSVKKIEVTEK